MPSKPEMYLKSMLVTEELEENTKQCNNEYFRKKRIVRVWYQPFHGETWCGSLTCTHEHISFHNLDRGRYGSSLVNVFSCVTLNWNLERMPAFLCVKLVTMHTEIKGKVLRKNKDIKWSRIGLRTEGITMIKQSWIFHLEHYLEK